MSTRLAGMGRLINKDKAVSFTFNGKHLRGFAGDTLASALLANDQMLMGRSFKYHRPRGAIAAGSEEPNALIGFAGAFRRSELGALTVDDVFVTDEGLRVNIRQSKTDQEAQGQQIAIPNGKMQAVDVLFDWLDHAGIVDGYVFRGFYKGGRTIRTNKLSGQAVADIVKTYALKAGFNPAEFAGHSLRSGFVTSAAENGANLFKIMDVSRHKSVQTIREYVRHGVHQAWRPPVKGFRRRVMLAEPHYYCVRLITRHIGVQ